MSNKWLAPCFWGSADSQKLLEDLSALFAPFASSIFAGDNLVTVGRNLSFLRDKPFMDAFRDAIHESNTVGNAIIWRLHTLCWAAATAQIRQGDFVECGVSTGTCSAVMCKYLDFAKQERSLYLYDAWGQDTRIPSEKYGFTDQTLDFVRQRFRAYPNVTLVPGFLPDSFQDAVPEKIAFLHIDLNSADAEIAVLEALFDRVVEGGIILFDDYGFDGFRRGQDMEIEWMKKRNYHILELPTGQGMVIK